MAESADERRDELTGALNYEAFVEQFDRQMAEAKERDGCISLALADLDHFKAVNDKHGHLVGDEVLKALARHLADCASGKGTTVRYTRDEFLVLLPGVEKEEAFLLMEGARKDFDKERVFKAADSEVKLRVQVSIGVASYPEDGGNATELVRKASDAMCRAKLTAGRNKVCLAREERMVTKTSHYSQGQLERLSALAKREGVGEAVLLREALDDLLRKYSL